MLVEGQYDPKTLESMYDDGFSGSFWKGKLKFQHHTPRHLTIEEKAKLNTMVKEDKTFAIFLSEAGLRKLPSELSYIIINSGNLAALSDFVLPEYKKRADLLLATPAIPA